MALVIRLDEAVTDETLPKMGELIVDVNLSHNSPFGFLNGDSAEYSARIIGEGNFFTDANYTTSAGKSITQTSSVLYISSGSYKLGISPKYGVKSIGQDLPLLTDLNALSIDCEQLKYSESTFSLLASHWKLENFSAENMKNCSMLSANGATLAVDVAEFKSLASLTSVNVSNTGSFGDAVDAFGGKLGLTRLVYAGTQCTGTYSAVCDAMYANGRTSGSMVIGDNSGLGLKTATFSANGWTAA